MPDAMVPFFSATDAGPNIIMTANTFAIIYNYPFILLSRRPIYDILSSSDRKEH